MATDEIDDVAARRRWTAILAKAPASALEAAWESLPERPAYSLLRRPEIGLVMVRGRIGGSGGPFNLGEMTMTRAAVRLEGEDEAGIAGFGHIAGRDVRHAELAAVIDAMLQTRRWRDLVAARILEPLAAAQQAKRAAAAAKTAATKVEFFTLVRGD
jgi:alpha-D-ribose 1-methylphosphonate 5-triphosphate synthase subunit PhnG